MCCVLGTDVLCLLTYVDNYFGCRRHVSAHRLSLRALYVLSRKGCLFFIAVPMVQVDISKNLKKKMNAFYTCAHTNRSTTQWHRQTDRQTHGKRRREQENGDENWETADVNFVQSSDSSFSLSIWKTKQFVTLGHSRRGFGSEWWTGKGGAM